MEQTTELLIRFCICLIFCISKSMSTRLSQPNVVKTPHGSIRARQPAASQQQLGEDRVSRRADAATILDTIKYLLRSQYNAKK